MQTMFDCVVPFSKSVTRYRTEQNSEIDLSAWEVMFHYKYKDNFLSVKICLYKYL